MMILGCIKRVENYFLVINLPSLMNGKVNVNCVSDQYTEALQNLTEDDENNTVRVNTAL